MMVVGFRGKRIGWNAAAMATPIAMGNASLEVQHAARRITSATADNGFAKAIEKYVLA
jgi:hydroxymethylpyrimidine pyrophosphatase-like HAD family hydrolase